MGSGLAKNLIAERFAVTGFGLSEPCMNAFREMGGAPARSVAEVGAHSDAACVAALNGGQAKPAILGDAGLEGHMGAGGAINLIATTGPREARDFGVVSDGRGNHLVDAPVSGGFPGAQGGTLTMMASAADAVLRQFAPAMGSVSGAVHRVGDASSIGQTVKASLQAREGSALSSTFGARVLATKAGEPGGILVDVLSAIGAACGCANSGPGGAIGGIVENAGSGIGSKRKDLAILPDLAEEHVMPMQLESTATQNFQAGNPKRQPGDNRGCTRVIEDVVDTELHREGKR